MIGLKSHGVRELLNDPAPASPLFGWDLTGDGIEALLTHGTWYDWLTITALLLYGWLCAFGVPQWIWRRPDPYDDAHE